MFGKALLRGLTAAGVFLAIAVGAAEAAQRPAAAVLLDRLCADKLLANEEDRLYGMISLTVRATIKYRNGVFSPDLIDDAVQESLAAITAACPQIAATEDGQRLGMVVALISEVTLRHLPDGKAKLKDKAASDAQTEKASAADLSEELSAPEIDAWLAALPARQRALAAFLYASDVGNNTVADAVGLPPAALAAASRGVKSNLLRFFRSDWDAPTPPPVPDAPAIEFSEAAQDLAVLLAPPASPDRPAAMTARVTGISSEVYAGWSLLATVTGLPADRQLELAAPILLEPDAPGHRRMIAVALDEIADSHDAIRRFLVKAYAIDADKAGAGVRDGFHLGPALDNAAALETLRNPALAAIEVARCLWHDYGTAPDPGLCR